MWLIFQQQKRFEYYKGSDIKYEDMKHVAHVERLYLSSGQVVPTSNKNTYLN